MPAPGGNSRLGLISGLWLGNMIYYGQWVMLQRSPGLPLMELRLPLRRGSKDPGDQNWCHVHAAGSAGRFSRLVTLASHISHPFFIAFLLLTANGIVPK